MINLRVLIILWAALYHGILPCFGQTNIHLDPTILRNGCPGEVVTLTCTTIGSTIIAWRSDEYIGTGGAQLEFATINNVGSTVSSARYPSTVATLTGRTLDSNNLELTSTLQIILSASFQRASVTCVNVGTGETINAIISLLDEAEALSGVRSVLKREPNNMCAVDLMWDLPPNFADVSHFTVTINDEEPNVMSQTSTSYTRCFCDPHNVTITLVDRCGRTGSSTSVITLNTKQPLFECDLPTTVSTTRTADTITTYNRFDLKNTSILSLLIALICVCLLFVIYFIVSCIIVHRLWSRVYTDKNDETDYEKKELPAEKDNLDSEKKELNTVTDDLNAEPDTEKEKLENEKENANTQEHQLQKMNTTAGRLAWGQQKKGTAKPQTQQSGNSTSSSPPEQQKEGRFFSPKKTSITVSESRQELLNVAADDPEST